jgi:hypothetical protein
MPYLLMNRVDWSVIAGPFETRQEALDFAQRRRDRDAGADFSGPAPDYVAVQASED